MSLFHQPQRILRFFKAKLWFCGGQLSVWSAFKIFCLGLVTLLDYYFCLEEINTLISSLTPLCYSSICYITLPSLETQLLFYLSLLYLLHSPLLGWEKITAAVTEKMQAGPHFCFHWALPQDLCEMCVEGSKRKECKVQKCGSYCWSCCVCNKERAKNCGSLISP